MSLVVGAINFALPVPLCTGAYRLEIISAKLQGSSTTRVWYGLQHKKILTLNW